MLYKYISFILCISHKANDPGKGMNPTILSPPTAMDKQLDRLDSLTLCRGAGVCIYSTSPHHRQHVTQGQLLRLLKLVLIQNFPPRLVASRRVENSVYSTIYSWKENKRIHAFPAQSDTNSFFHLNLGRRFHFLRR